MSQQKTRPSKMRWLVWTIVIVIGVVVLGAIALPNFVKARSTSCANACINNLRQIDAAINQFALEHNQTNGATIHFPDDLTPYIKLNSAGKIPACPDGGIYQVGKVGDAPVCSLGGKVTPSHILW
jgi:type II secretory pathway pseudopilin PulG